MKMKKIWGIATAILVLAGCSKGPDEDGGTISRAPTTVTLTVSDDANALAELSRATDPGSADERKITKIEVWVFHAAGEPDAGELAKYASSTSSENTVTFVMNGGKYDFYVVTNQNIGTLADKTALFGQLATPDLTAANSRIVPPGGFPMTGTEIGYTLDGAQSSHNLPILIKRRVARFSAPTATSGLKVVLSDASGLDAVMPQPMAYNSAASNLDFALTGYAIVNGIDKSWLFHTSRRDVAWSMPTGGSYRTSSFDGDGNYTDVYSGLAEYPNIWFLTPSSGESVYVYENYPSQKSAGGHTGFDRREVYAAIIRGTITQTGVPANTTTRYWRINLVRGSPSLPQNFKIEENRIYEINIDEILSLGWATPQAAEEEANTPPFILPTGQTSVVIEPRVVEWEIFQENVSAS